MKHVRLTEKDLFALYSLPEEDHYHLVKQSDTKIEAHDDKPGFIIRPFANESSVPNVLIRADLQLINPKIELNLRTSVRYTCSTQEAYLIKAQHYLEALHAERVNKLVLSRRIEQSYDASRLWYHFIKLKQTYPDVFVYLFCIPQVGVWLGATPETLLRWDTHQATTMALAGTQKGGYHGEWDGKNQAEHQAVVRYIADRLTAAEYTYEIGDRNIRLAGPVQHLCTPFTIKTTDKMMHLAEILHPTPAVCGAPIEQALPLIHQLEGYDRKYYTGYLGPVGIHDQHALFVNLRCMELGSDHMYLYVGGGFMKDSVLMDEWNETQIKGKTLLNILMDDH